MKNYVQKGEKLPVTAPVDVVSGNLVIVNDLHGIAITSGVAGSEITIATEGVFELPYEDNRVDLSPTISLFKSVKLSFQFNHQLPLLLRAKRQA